MKQNGRLSNILTCTCIRLTGIDVYWLFGYLKRATSRFFFQWSQMNIVDAEFTHGSVSFTKHVPKIHTKRYTDIKECFASISFKSFNGNNNDNNKGWHSTSKGTLELITRPAVEARIAKNYHVRSAKSSRVWCPSLDCCWLRPQRRPAA